MDRREGQTASVPASPARATSNRLCRDLRALARREGGEIDTVTILTCPSNRTVMARHDRMPVVLAPEHFATWLDVRGTSPEEAAALLKPAPDDLFEAIEMHLRSTTLSATSQAS